MNQHTLKFLFRAAAFVLTFVLGSACAVSPVDSPPSGSIDYFADLEQVETAGKADSASCGDGEAPFDRQCRNEAWFAANLGYEPIDAFEDAQFDRSLPIASFTVSRLFSKIHFVALWGTANGSEFIRVYADKNFNSYPYYLEPTVYWASTIQISGGEANPQVTATAWSKEQDVLITVPVQAAATESATELDASDAVWREAANDCFDHYANMDGAWLASVVVDDLVRTSDDLFEASLEALKIATAATILTYGILLPVSLGSLVASVGLVVVGGVVWLMSAVARLFSRPSADELPAQLRECLEETGI